MLRPKRLSLIDERFGGQIRKCYLIELVVARKK
jgi:hypothetical protein